MSEIRAKEKWRVDKTVNLATLLSIALLVGSGAFGAVQLWMGFDKRTAILETQVANFQKQNQQQLETMQKSLEQTQRQTNRLEKYVSSRDPHYWRAITENGDSDR